MANKNRVLVFSIALGGYASLFRDCIESQKKYCSRFDFGYINLKKSPYVLAPAEAAWLKVFLLREALSCDYDYIAFVDADCEIRKHAPSFVEVLRKKPSKHIFMCHGFSGRINSGVIFLKNTPQAHTYLETVLDNRHKKVPEEDKALYENGHMIHYGKNNADVEILDFKKWNNNHYLDPTSYIQHYSGGILREKYLKSHTLARKRYKLTQKIRKYGRKFLKRTEQGKENGLEKSLEFFRKNYKELDCSN
ncbi:hypothetical protein NE848_07360 [Gramella jeungdoensis]|uniref:Uncharacterized protein n=1 Tax=Gramella jeungdoensis TaxID=708091 RepID=A0ABT0Z1P7_9FLAO|nr:hypothetical protein [Gramella jeungdoensis]MCM8569190.1 hypothetical protein [Gramella jeungdoensis]